MKFYAQAEEDKALYELFKDKKDGFYVDVGAYSGITFSNTYLFELQGWRGICIEPHEGLFPQLQENRPNSICLKVAVWDRDADDVPFYATPWGSWSIVWEDKKKPPPTRPRPYVDLQHPQAKKLDTILEENDAPIGFEILSIDVEGTEWHILNGFNIEKYRPRVIVIEFPHAKPPLGTYFKEHEYTQVAKRNSANHIYCRDKEDAPIINKGWNK